MKDFVGTQIDIGDKAVYSRLLGGKLVMEEVEVFGFTDSKVRITPLSCMDEKRGYHPANPDRLVVVKKAKEFDSNPVANKKHDPLKFINWHNEFVNG